VERLGHGYEYLVLFDSGLRNVFMIMIFYNKKASFRQGQSVMNYSAYSVKKVNLS
jgi:hypothetical protein